VRVWTSEEGEVEGESAVFTGDSSLLARLGWGMSCESSLGRLSHLFVRQESDAAGGEGVTGPLNRMA
jgi:hypothetical protein